MDRAPRIPFPILALFCLDAILVAVYLVDAQLGSPLARYTHQHDLNAEGNFPAWLSSAKYLLAAGLLLYAVHGRVRRGEPRSWAVLIIPAILLAFSCDEVASIHESLGRNADGLVLPGGRAASMLSNTGAWTLAIGVPVVLAMIVVFFAVGRATFWKASALWRFVIGMAVMLTGALGIETLSNFLPHFGGSIEIASEEYLEMLGATVMLWAARDQALADLQETIATQAASSSVKEQKPAIGAYPIRHDAPAKKSA